ncbi:MarR family winged helix-turn-helix transcriptional regulator [Lentimicrobium sp. S6]|uniref:MarR family winged helix-turn-helix transcriptional regulator n=1 Tax=Lentimicrobium sp. S6 TaxID=2735872 RepID=UPI001556A7E5|nr:MarR family winged helix-turn-helix transcriptional regulator [Lentimicrobium sp. S6]NPD47753.1 winged helix-turn-helix transcriptional regulator [Lentimicrobium sp. S6]
MNQSLNILKELISHLENFAQTHSSHEPKLSEFLAYVESELSENSEEENPQDHKNGELFFRLLSISRTLKYEVKRALKTSLISTYEEYSFMIHIHHLTSIRKMELIKMHSMNGPSGIEVIRRLIKLKLIDEFDDSKDKRAKLIKLSELGEKEMTKVSSLIEELIDENGASLNMKEKANMIILLKKLMK